MENPTDKDRLQHKNTNCANRFRCEDKTVQPYDYRVRQGEPCHQYGEVARRSSLAIELSALCLNNTIRKRPANPLKTKYSRWWRLQIDCVILIDFFCALTCALATTHHHLQQILLELNIETLCRS